MSTTSVITVAATVNAPISKVWETWTEPQHITQWNAAADTWHCPSAANDLRKGGKFTSRMEAKDGSFGFDFGGIYDEVLPHKLISYTLDDGRKVDITFTVVGDITHVTESFVAENENPIEMQQGGWQAILDNYKKYTENL
ncbi:MAG: SRPBCC family protein [Flavipsychrobacter sp.]